MRTGAIAFGGPDFALSTLASGQLARRYGFPLKSAVTTGAKQTDAQAGYETQDGLWTAVASGATIVMYDASGVRQEAGKHAKALNRVIDAVFMGEAEWDDDRLKELLGHTSAQVVAGAAWGVAIFGMTRLVT